MTYSTTIADIESRWRPLSAAEKVIAPALIEDAEELLDTKRPSLPAAVAAGTVSERLARIAIVGAVKRVLANPDGVQAQGVSSDGSINVNFAVTSTRTGILSGAIFFLDEDLADIDRALAYAGISTGAGHSSRSVRLSAYDEPATVVDLYANIPAANRSATR